MNQNFFKSKNLHESSKLEHLNSMGGGKYLGGTNLGGKKFGPPKSLGFQQLSYLSYFGLGVKNLLDYLEKKYGNIG